MAWTGTTYTDNFQPKFLENFETGNVFTAGPSTSLTRTTSKALYNSYSMNMSKSATGAFNATATATVTGLVIGREYRLNTSVKAGGTSSHEVNAYIQGMTPDAPVTISYVSDNTGWYTVYYEFTATATSHVIVLDAKKVSDYTASVWWDYINVNYRMYSPNGWVASDSGAGGAQLFNSALYGWMMSSNTSQTASAQVIKKTISGLNVGTSYTYTASSKASSAATETQTVYIGITGGGSSTAKVHNAGGSTNSHSISFTATSTSHELYLYSLNNSYSGDNLFWTLVSLSYSQLNRNPVVTLNSVASFYPNAPGALTWNFSDADAPFGDYQRSYTVTIKKAGAVIHQSATVMSTATSYTPPANIFAQGGAENYTWYVAVSDNHTSSYGLTTSAEGSFSTLRLEQYPTLKLGTEWNGSTFAYYGNIPFSIKYTDLNADAISAYQIKIYTNSTLTALVWDSGKTAYSGTNALSQTINIDGETMSLIDTTTYYWEAQVWDSTDRASGWARTDAGAPGNFLTAPLPAGPTPNTVSALPNPGLPITFSWVYDPAATYPIGAYRVIIYNASTNLPVVDTGKVASSVNSFVLEAGQLQQTTSYYWTVNIWDTQDGQSAPSATSSFTTGNPGSVTITDPATNNYVINTNSYVIHWTFSSDQAVTQAKYKVVVTRVSDSNVLVDTGFVTSTATSYNITGLESDTLYNVQVVLQDTSVFDTPPANVTIFPDYNSPMKPTANLYATEQYVQIDVNNPTPVGSRPEPDFNEIYRKDGEDVYKLVGTCPADGTYKDFYIAANTQYTYQVKAVKN